VSPLRAFALPLLVLGLAMALRVFAIEPSHIGHACDPAPWSGWCGARTALIMAFRFKEIGWAAMAVGVLATFVRRAWLGQLALSLGLAGLVLYSYEPAVIGTLLGALVVFRPLPGPTTRARALPTAERASSESR
jgi:hypothetical protein